MRGDLAVGQDLAQEVGAGAGCRTWPTAVIEQLVERGRRELAVPVDALGVARQPLIGGGLAGVGGGGLGCHGSISSQGLEAEARGQDMPHVFSLAQLRVEARSGH